MSKKEERRFDSKVNCKWLIQLYSSHLRVFREVSISFTFHFRSLWLRHLMQYSAKPYRENETAKAVIVQRKQMTFALWPEICSKWLVNKRNSSHSLLLKSTRFQDSSKITCNIAPCQINITKEPKHPIRRYLVEHPLFENIHVIFPWLSYNERTTWFIVS